MKFLTFMREIFVLGLLFQVMIDGTTSSPLETTPKGSITPASTAKPTVKPTESVPITEIPKEQVPPATPFGNLTTVEPSTMPLPTEQTNTTNDQTTEAGTAKTVPTPPVPSVQSNTPVNEAASFKQTPLLLIPALFYTYTCL
uniref:Uncharacterized protein n=1 Tax=Panagrolaimus sp. JU765 TaxID=591449 RepID=A0AC34RB23_9BILA